MSSIVRHNKMQATTMRPTSSSSSRSASPKPSTRPTQSTGAGPIKKFTLWHAVLGILAAAAISIMMLSYQVVRSHRIGGSEQPSVHSTLEAYREDRSYTRRRGQQQQQQGPLTSSSSGSTKQQLPHALQSVLDRALHYQNHCQRVVLQEQQPGKTQRKSAVKLSNLTGVDLPGFGIITALQRYAESSSSHDHSEYEYECALPPETECQETQVTVIFMGYNPDRLQMMKQQIFSMLHYSNWKTLVKEVVLVWNGPRQIDESAIGKKLLQMQTTYPNKFRIFYPLLEGFPNDLMNRYHPRFHITTKAILFYDDDGPFYSYNAVLGGFELWKRNANAEIDAMARKIDVSPRQETEKKGILNGVGDRFFVSHCGAGGGSDTVVYNYHFFAQFGANMALPSGSFFHSNYLCWIWHPALSELRQFVKDHPVHPDDATVSMIISQLTGRAPKVYSRRINEATAPQQQQQQPQDQQQQQQQRKRQRRLLLSIEGNDNTSLVSSSTYNMDRSVESDNEWLYDNVDSRGWELEESAVDVSLHGRKLLWEQQDWGNMRREAVDSLVSYFGSLNSGSIGWCYGTQWQVAGSEECLPDQAKPGMLPWMQPDHTPKTTCP